MIARVKGIAQIALIVVICGLGLAIARAVWQATPGLVGDLAKTGQALDATTAAAVSVKTTADKVSAIADTNQAKIGQAIDNATAATANLRVASHGLTIAIAEVNRPCVPHGASCGLIADMARTLATFRGAAGQLEAAAYHENKRIGVIDGQEQQLADDTHNALVSLTTASQSISDLASNKDLASTFKQVNGIVTAGATMARDTQEKLHAWLHPHWPARIYGEVKSWGAVALQWFIK